MSEAGETPRVIPALSGNCNDPAMRVVQARSATAEDLTVIEANRRENEQNAWSTVTILPTSARAQASVFRPAAVIAGRETRVLIDQVRTMDISYIAGELVDYLSRNDMAEVEHVLSRYLGLTH